MSRAGADDMDEQLCMLGFGVALPEKIEKALATFQLYEPEALRRDPVNGYYLCDSYGKDSCVILDLAKRSGVRFKAHHNLTTLDPPELLRFGRQHHPETVVHRPTCPLLLALVNRGLPTRLHRWCCAEYKETSGTAAVRVFGVRAAESLRRKNYWRVWHQWTANRDGGGERTWILNPILYWTDADLWQYIRERNLPYCSLYDDGFTRLGCIGCPMAGEGRRREFARWPGYERAWRTAIAKFYAKWHGVPREDGKPRWFDQPDSCIHNGDDLWRWWMEELPAPDEDDCQMGLF